MKTTEACERLKDLYMLEISHMVNLLMMYFKQKNLLYI